MKSKIFLFLFLPFTVFAQQPNNALNAAQNIIRDIDTIVTPNGIQESYFLNIGDVDHWINIRGKNKDNPVLVFVHGGPASPVAPTAWSFQRPLEEYFTVVHYDQRGAGKTFFANDTIDLGKTIQIEQYVQDALDIVDHIRQKLNKEKVLLVGHSWGTIVSTKAALKNPDVFYAYVGIGQVVNTKLNEKLSFEFGQNKASELKNHKALEEMATIAPYPGDKPITRDRIVLARKWPQYYGGLAAYRSDFSFLFNAQKLSPLYTPEERAAINDGSLFTLSKLLPEFLEVDFLSIKEFSIPIFILMGKHDYSTPSNLSQEWIDNMKAPIKRGIWFEHSSHYIQMEEPGKMFLVFVNDILPLIKE